MVTLPTETPLSRTYPISDVAYYMSSAEEPIERIYFPGDDPNSRSHLSISCSCKYLMDSIMIAIQVLSSAAKMVSSAEKIALSSLQYL